MPGLAEIRMNTKTPVGALLPPGFFLPCDYFPKLSMISTISAPMRFWASLVAAPMWGVQETLGWL